MIDVPRYGQPGVGQTPLPSIHAPTEVFMPASPVDLSGVQNVVGKIWTDEKKKADEVAVTAASSQLAQLQTDLLYDPQNGALNKHGKDAFSTPETVEDAWSKKVNDIESGLGSDEQRIAFGRVESEQHAEMQRVLQRHVATERQGYDTSSTDSFVTNTRNKAIATYNDPKVTQASITDQTAAITAYGQRNGLPSEKIKELTDDAVSKTHVGIINHMLADNQDIMAEYYYNEHKDQITGEDQIQTGKAVDEGSSRAEAQDLRDKIMSKNPDEPTAIAAVRKVKNPRVQALLETLVRSDFEEQKNAQREQTEKNMVLSGNLIDQQHSITAIPPNIWETFSPAEKAQLQDYADNSSGTKKIKTDWQQYYGLRMMASSQVTRQKFIDTNLYQFRGQMADAQFEDLVNTQAAMRNGDDKINNKLDDFNFRQGIVTQTLRGVGIGVDNTAAGRKRDDPIMADVRRSVEQQVETLQENTKRPATAKEVQQIVDDMVTSHIASHPGHWYNPFTWGGTTDSTRLMNMTPNDSLVLTVKDIPKSDKAALIAQRRAAGLPITDEALVSAYRNYLQGLVKHGPR